MNDPNVAGCKVLLASTVAPEVQYCRVVLYNDASALNSGDFMIINSFDVFRFNGRSRGTSW